MATEIVRSLLWRQTETAFTPWKGESLWGYLAAPFSSQNSYKRAGGRYFKRICSDKTRGSGLNWKDNKYRLPIRKKSSVVRVVRHWNRFPRESVDAPFLKVLKTRLHVTLSSLFLWKASLPMVGGWNEMVFNVPFNLNPPMIHQAGIQENNRKFKIFQLLVNWNICKKLFLFACIYR